MRGGLLGVYVYLVCVCVCVCVCVYVCVVCVGSTKLARSSHVLQRVGVAEIFYQDPGR